MTAHFSGHETFQCKSLWPKKAYDFVNEGGDFRADDAVIRLGVGKNMVASMRYWMRAFGLLDSTDTPTPTACLLLEDNGADPFLEDTNTLWLLHYLLIKNDYATLYHSIFIDYHRYSNTFTKEKAVAFIRQAHLEKRFSGFTFNENTVGKDFQTLLKMYVPPTAKNIDDFSSIFLDLQLLTEESRGEYTFNYASKSRMHPLIFLYAIIDSFENEKVIEFEKLLHLSLIFCLSKNELYGILEEIGKIYPEIRFSNVAGEHLFTIDMQLSRDQILNRYYHLK